jgi:class 3 adenylate cyclase/tetratricopeptide (TPR) repeat protein
MSQLESWLQRHGLSSIAELLKSHDVTFDILPELTEQDLRDLGLSLGLRRTLERAIRQDPPASTEAPAERPTSTLLPDRRQLTVVFVDLVGSTALSRQLDPEDLMRVVRAYQNTVAGEIARYQGHVAQLLGDGVLCYFGWPVADEFGAERAARASLDVIRAIAGLSVPSEPALAVRIGIATGLVVVGELLAEGQPQEPMVSGETPNLAARLQQLAAPGTILVAPETRRILANAFIFERVDVGPAKGFEDGVDAFRLVGEVRGGTRFAQRHGPDLAQILGRDQEIGLLHARWRQALRGEGQGVLLVGEAGIGKSRILRALLDELGSDPYHRIEAQCSPYFLDRPLWPIAESLRSSFGIRPSQPMTEQLQHLEHALRGLAVGLAEAVPLNAELLDIVYAPSYPVLDLSPQQKRNRTLQVLADQILALAHRAPTVVILEDAHWVDPSTLEFVEIVLQAVMHAPVLVIITSRPDNPPNLAAHPHVTRLSLNRLGRESVEVMIKRIAGDLASDEFVSDIVAKTDGMPLFVEELTKALVETRRTEEAGKPLLSYQGVVPPTLYDSLMARLDRIPEVKELAQTAACIGRDFEFRTLAGVAGIKHETLLSGLDRLVEAELLFQRGTPPDAMYSFKHALVRDAAYESQLRSRRREIHEAIVRTMESSSATSHPEVVAQHAVQAGDIQKAITLFIQAGRQASARFANREALQNFNNAFRLLESMPAGLERDRRELDLRLELGLPLIAIRGYASEEVEDHYNETVQLSKQLADSDAEFTSTRSLWNCVYDRGNLDWSFDLADQLLQLANAADSDEKRALAYRALGSTLMNRAEFTRAAEAFANSLSAGTSLPPATWIKTHGEAPLLIAEQYMGFICAVRGLLDQALRYTRSAVEGAEKLGHPITRAFARAIHAHVLLMRRDYAGCAQVAKETSQLSAAHGFVFWSAHTEIHEGVAIAHLHRSEAGLKLAERGLKNWMASGARLHVPTWSAYLAEAALVLGRHERAGELLAHAQRVSDSTGDFFARAEIDRLNGRLLLLTGKRSDGQSSLERALNLAHHQGATLFELRAATDLAELFVDDRDYKRARDMLGPVAASFRERECVDYRQAAALLSKVEACQAHGSHSAAVAAGPGRRGD